MTQADRPKITLDHAELLVLSVLADAPSYGYAITKTIAAGSDGSIELGPAKLYPLLSKLEKQKLVTTSWEEVKAEGADDDASGRRRKWYRISAKGKARLAQRVESHRRLTSVIDAFIGGGSNEGRADACA